MASRPKITADGMLFEAGGYREASVLARNRWKREVIGVVPVPDGSLDWSRHAFSVLGASTPPTLPVYGVSYLVSPLATGAWAGHENEIATHDGSAWSFKKPTQGQIVYNLATHKLLAWSDDRGWSAIGPYELEMPKRLSGYATSNTITDANAASEFGVYYAPPTAANTPYAADWSIFILPLGTHHSTQWATEQGSDSATNGLTFRRDKNNGVWSSTWTREYSSEGELDARYVTRADTNQTITGNRLSFNTLGRRTSPPGAPSVGDRYIIASPATGEWAGREGQHAERNATGWNYSTVTEGQAFWIADEDRFFVHDGSALRLIGGQDVTYLFRYSLVDSAGTIFGPIDSATDYTGQPWTAVFPAAVLGTGTQYHGFGAVSTASTTTSTTIGEATALKIGTQKYWYYAASYSATKPAGDISGGTMSEFGNV